MNLPQENFERALRSADNTLKTLSGSYPSQISLSHAPTQRLRDWLWDLEALGAALRLELMNREDSEPIDLG